MENVIIEPDGALFAGRTYPIVDALRCRCSSAQMWKKSCDDSPASSCTLR